MTALRSPLAISIAALIGTSLIGRAQQPAALDVQDMQKADQLMQQGKYDEALRIAQGIPQNYPTSGLIPGANLVQAICNYFLKDYDKAVEAASKNLAPGSKANPEVLESSAILVPNVLSTKAGELPPGQEVLKKKTFEDAVKGYDEFIQKFPKSEEVETALLGKGRALALSGNFEDAAKVLKEGMEKFPKSPTIQDTKFMLGLTLAQQGIKASQNTGGDATSKVALDDSEKQFRDIITARQDLVLMNNSFMQLGDVLALKASLAPRDSAEAKKLNEQALDFYREVRPKDEVVRVQEQRIQFWRNQAETARTQADPAGIKRFRRIAEKETEKLEAVKSTTDQSIAAKMKAAANFIALDRYDEARVLLRFIAGFVENNPDTEEDHKKIDYFTTVTYAAQHIVEKAIAGYEKFNTTYKADPIAENLPLLIGNIFLDPDPKINDPSKAMKYFDEEISTYPNSKFAGNAAVAKAAALIQQQKYDEALKSLRDFLTKATDKSLQAEAEFNIAVVQREKGAIDDAIAAFKAVRDKHPDSPQAEQAAFWIGQMSPEGKNQVAELTNFISKYPNSTLLSSAYYFKAKAQSNMNDNAAAIKSYRDVIEKFPDSEPAPGAFFETAKILKAEADENAAKAKGKGKADYTPVRTLLKEFVTKYPTSDKVYASYSFGAELFVAEDKPEEAIKFYEEYIANNSANPDVAKARLAIANIYNTQATKLGTYLSMGKDDQAKWTTLIKAAINNAEKGIESFPESDEVSRLLELILKIDTTMLNVGLMKEPDVKSYFTSLAGKFEGKSTKSKILFAVANFIEDRSKGKDDSWFGIVDAAYNPELVYSPSDLDLYGTELLRRKQVDKAKAIFEKLDKDYPVPPNSEPGKVSRTVGEAQAVYMSGMANVLQTQGKAADGKALFEKVKSLYPWSSKVAEADFGIGQSFFDQKKYSEAIDVLKSVAGKNTGTVSLRARAMMLLAKSLEAEKDYEGAINNYIKIAHFFESEKEIAAEGLWLGAQLLEKQSKGEIVPQPPKPKPAATPKKDGSAKPGASPKPGATPNAASKKA